MATEISLSLTGKVRVKTLCSRGWPSPSRFLRQIASGEPFFSSTHDLGERDSDHKRPPVKQVLNEGADSEDREAGNAGHEEIYADDRPPWIEAARADARRAEKSGGEGRQQESEPRAWVRRRGGADVENAGRRAHRARADEASQSNSVNRDPAQPRDVPSPADEQ